MEWENTVRVLNEFGKELVDRYKEGLVIHNANATGGLRDSLRYLIKVDDRTIDLNLNLKHYWYYLEHGRQAGKWPPIQAIKDWITAKGIVPRERDGKLPTPEQLPYMIQASIKRDGIEGRYIYKDSMEDTWSEFRNKLDEAVTKDIEGNLAFVNIILG